MYSGSLLLGNRSRHEDEACRHHFFSGKEAPEYLLADGKSIDCPFYGKFVEEKAEDRQNTRMVSYNTAAGKILDTNKIPLQNCKSFLFPRQATMSKLDPEWLSFVHRHARSSVRIIPTKDER